MSLIEKTISSGRNLKWPNWLKSFRCVKGCIPKGWTWPSDEGPSIAYMAKNYDSIAWGLYQCQW